MRDPHQRHYLSFTRKERMGMLLLIVLMIILFILPAFFTRNAQLPDPAAVAAFQAALSKLDIRQKDSMQTETVDTENKVAPAKRDVAYPGRNNSPPVMTNLFPFDPNRLDAEDWKKLGLRDRTIQTIEHYLAKGGKFQKAEDLCKIYGLSESLVNRLMPFVRIQHDAVRPKQEMATIESRPKNNFRPDSLPRFRDKPVPQMIDINLADSVAWMSLPGIGPVLAGRIIRFRKKLGSFNSIEQVGTTYGLSDSVFQKIKKYLTATYPPTP